jgi:hypothetical protein
MVLFKSAILSKGTFDLPLHKDHCFPEPDREERVLFLLFYRVQPIQRPASANAERKEKYYKVRAGTFLLFPHLIIHIRHLYQGRSMPSHSFQNRKKIASVRSLIRKLAAKSRIEKDGLH